MSSKLSTRSEITRENLVEVFWMLYCKKRIEKITVKEICQISGYNRSTFYAYFHDVYEVLEEIENRTIEAEDFRDIILKQQIQNYSGSKKIERVLLALMLELFEKNSKYLPVLLGENGDPLFRQKLLNKLVPTVFSMYKDLKAIEIVKVKYLMEYQSAAMLSTIAKWYSNKKDLPAEDFVELLLLVTSNGIQNEMKKYLK